MQSRRGKVRGGPPLSGGTRKQKQRKNNKQRKNEQQDTGKWNSESKETWRKFEPIQNEETPSIQEYQQMQMYDDYEMDKKRMENNELNKKNIKINEIMGFENMDEHLRKALQEQEWKDLEKSSRTSKII